MTGEFNQRLRVAGAVAALVSSLSHELEVETRFHAAYALAKLG